MARAGRTPSLIGIDLESGMPKYRQLIAGVQRAVRSGSLRRGDPVPSINELCRAHRLSRDTVVKAYNALKKSGVLASAQGKGFTVATEHITEAVKVFVLFDAFTPYKETLNDAMRAEADGRLDLDIYFHHHLYHQCYQVRLC